jgi:hypothetical protein
MRLTEDQFKYGNYFKSVANGILTEKDWEYAVSRIVQLIKVKEYR